MAGMTIGEAYEKAGSIRGAAKLLGIPESTLRGTVKRDGWRIAKDYHYKGQDEQEPENTITHADTTKNYYTYATASDRYYFHLVSRDEPFKIPGKVFREIVWDYPRQGGNKTKAQISLERGIPLPVLEKILRTYGLYKHSTPYTIEVFEEADDEQLVQMQEDTIEKRQYNWLAETEKREHQALVKEVNQLRAFKANQESLTDKLAEATERALARTNPFYTKVKPQTVQGGFLDGEDTIIHAPLADLHGGMLAWARETWGGNFDTTIAAAIDVQHAQAVANFVRRIGGRCKELWSTDLGDHFNGLDLETMHGTPQEQDGRPFFVWERMFEAAVKKIEILREICEVLRVRFIPGNHDHIHVQHFFHSLQQRFYYADDVEIVVHPRWQESFVVGRSLHTLDHGQGFPRDVGSDKAISMAKRTVRNAGGEDYYNTRWHYLYLGHLHNEGRAEDDNLKVYRLPAAADQTDWENRSRWTANPSARVFQLDDQGRVGLEQPLFFREGYQKGSRV